MVAKRFVLDLFSTFYLAKIIRCTLQACCANGVIPAKFVPFREKLRDSGGNYRDRAISF